MKIKFKTTFSGAEVYQSGRVYDVDKEFAQRLLSSGDGELIIDEKEKANTATKKV